METRDRPIVAGSVHRQRFERWTQEHQMQAHGSPGSRIWRLRALKGSWHSIGSKDCPRRQLADRKAHEAAVRARMELAQYGAVSETGLLSLSKRRQDEWQRERRESG